MRAGIHCLGRWGHQGGRRTAPVFFSRPPGPWVTVDPLFRNVDPPVWYDTDVKLFEIQRV